MEIIDYPTVSCIYTEKKHIYTEILKENDFCIYEINGNKIFNGQSFYQNIIDALPLDPALSKQGLYNLDGISDSIWGGIDHLVDYHGVDRVAFLWDHVDNIVVHGLNDLLDIIHCFQYLGNDLLTTEYGLTKPVCFLVFLIGSKDKLSVIEHKIDITKFD